MSAEKHRLEVMVGMECGVWFLGMKPKKTVLLPILTYYGHKTAINSSLGRTSLR